VGFATVQRYPARPRDTGTAKLWTARPVGQPSDENQITGHARRAISKALPDPGSTPGASTFFLIIFAMLRNGRNFVPSLCPRLALDLLLQSRTIAVFLRNIPGAVRLAVGNVRGISPPREQARLRALAPTVGQPPQDRVPIRTDPPPCAAPH
jgi:hypothetical protein